jgi:hypothetical protein
VARSGRGFSMSYEASAQCAEFSGNEHEGANDSFHKKSQWDECDVRLAPNPLGLAAHSPGGKADPLTCLGLRALVHGVAKLILEGGIQPSEYGFKNGLALAVRVLGQRVE